MGGELEKAHKASTRGITIGLGKLLGFVLSLSASVFIFVKTTYETAVDAKATAHTNRDILNGIEVRIADKVYDKMLIQNNAIMNHIDTKFEKINSELYKIKAKIGE